MKLREALSNFSKLGCLKDHDPFQDTTELHYLVKDPHNTTKVDDYLCSHSGIKVVDAKDHEGRTPLHIAVRHKVESEYSSLLIARHCDIEAIDDLRETALSLAVLSGAIAQVKILLNAGVDVNRLVGPCQVGILYYALHPETRYAANNLKEHFQIVELLINAGATTDIRDEFDNTLIHLAIGNATYHDAYHYEALPITRRRALTNPDTVFSSSSSNFESCIDLLITAGVAVDATNVFGHDALYYTELQCNWVYASYLLKAVDTLRKKRYETS